MDPFAPPATSGPGAIAKKRRRPALACEQCRRRKIKCDRNSPCNHCIKSNIPTCSYAPTHTPASRSRPKKPLVTSDSGVSDHSSPSRARQPPAQSLTPDSPSATTGSPSEYISPGAGVFPTLASLTGPLEAADSGLDSGHVNALKKRITMLEKRLAEGISFRDDDSKVFMRDDADSPAPVKGTISKTRYFGPTHWMNGADMFPLEMGVFIRSELAKDDMSQCMHKCKRLARRIKARRVQPLSSRSLGRQLPSRELADQLVNLYLSTFEGVLRVLHVPSFKADYERYWADPTAANDFFVILMQLCMALGATLYDGHFSLRKMAQQWVYEGQMWVMLPPEKSRLTIAGLQITCLLVQAKEACGVGGDLAWFMTGTLVRKAMYMGLHRDPKHLATMSVFRAEMRRRLWATILELNLQTAMDAGGSTLLSQRNYDTEPPSNLDDEQLSDNPEAKDSTVVPRDRPTQTSLQIALLESFPLRSHILKHVNEFRASDSYEETLRLNSELTKLCRSLTSKLSSLLNRSGPSGEAVDGLSPEANAPHRVQITPFHKDYAELLIYRCFHALHQPVMTRSLNHPRFFFSRKMAIDSALKILHICGITRQDPTVDPSSPEAVPAEPSVYRITINGAGVWRNLPVQSMFAVAVELLSQKEESNYGMGYFHHHSAGDSLTALTASAAWTLERIRSGETSVKGYAFIHARLGHVRALEAAKEKSEVEKSIGEEILVATGQALLVLKDLAVREGMDVEEVAAAEHNVNEPGQAPQAGHETEEAQHRQLVGSDGEGMGSFGGEVGMEWIMDFPWEDMEWPQAFGDVGMMDMGGDGNWGSTMTMPPLQPTS